LRDYGVVSPRFWVGETGKSLRGDPEAQVLALYLMTSPHSTMTGVFHCPLLYMAHETGSSLEGASKALQRLLASGFCEYDEASETVFVIQMARFQVGEELKPKDNRVVALKKEFLKMPKTYLKQRFLDVYAKRYHLTDLASEISPFEAPSKPLRSQEQDQEQEQDQDQDGGAVDTPEVISESGENFQPPSEVTPPPAGNATPPIEHPARANPIDAWQPDPDTLSAIQRLGVPEKFIREQLPEFVTYWRDRNQPRTSWNSKFYSRCLAEWKRHGHHWRENPDAAADKKSQSDALREATIGATRSDWANGL